MAVKAVILSFKTKVLKGSMLWPVERFFLLKQVVSCSASINNSIELLKNVVLIISCDKADIIS